VLKYHKCHLHKIELREQMQKVKKEHDTRFLDVEEHPLMDGDIYEDWMDNNESPQNLQHQ
jgi:hypothetical protein